MIPQESIRISAACNDPETGQPTNRAEFFTFEDSRNEYLNLHGPELTFYPRINHTHVQIGRRRYAIEGYTLYVGNWCWDTCIVTSAIAQKIAEYLRERGFQCEGGTLHEIWETGRPVLFEPHDDL